MGDRRKLLGEGDILMLGGMDYRVESVEGCGGSSVVYRASYEDRLNHECRHYVLIKELFPYHPKGDIYRDASGEICCRGDGADIMERHMQSFYRGNQANLRLLEKSPEKVSGNINSYSTYGTFYSVLSIHGGRSLGRILDDRQKPWSLKETAGMILKILEAVECFHDSGILHLDISPDNILMLPEQAFLIDYNSVWIIGGQDGGEYYFSEKPGYSAPEVRLREWKNIGQATDIYSVCAVWFRMLTGRSLAYEDIAENRLRKSLGQDLEIFSKESESAVKKTVQIITKGLHVLARMRYENTALMREDIEQLIKLADKKQALQAVEQNRRKMRALLALIIMILTGAACVWRAQQPYRLNAQERYQLKEVMYQVTRNMAALGIQLDIQQQILECALQKEVLEGDKDALCRFYETLDHKRREAGHYSFERSADNDVLESLDIPGADVPVDILDELLDKTYDMDVIMEEGLTRLEDEFKMTSLSYTDRQEVASFYRDYLYAYAETTYREMCLVMARLDEETAGEMLDIMTQVPVLKDYISVCPYEGKSIKQLEAELNTSKARMKQCMNDMRSRNYVISAESWNGD